MRLSWYVRTYEHLICHAQLKSAWKKNYNLEAWSTRSDAALGGAYSMGSFP